MSTPNNSIKVYDRDDLLTIISDLWLHDPHASVWTRLIATHLELRDECTGVHNVAVRKLEEKKNLCHKKTLQSRQCGICLHENAVMLRRGMMPRWHRAYELLVHAACARQVTRCIISSHCGVEDEYLHLENHPLVLALDYI